MCNIFVGAGAVGAKAASCYGYAQIRGGGGS
jgi:hypothetical protein